MDNSIMKDMQDVARVSDNQKRLYVTTHSEV